MEIPVNRIRPLVGENALSWSEDGDLAIVAVPNVIVYSAKDYSAGSKLEFSRSEVTGPEHFEYNKKISTNSSINHADFAPSAAISAGWSPTGMTSSGGCFLSVLTSKHQFLLFQDVGSPTAPEYVFSADLSWGLTTGSSSNAPAIRCSDWTRVDDGSVWGYSFLALGTESGLFIYKVWQGNFELVEQRADILECRKLKYAGTLLYIQTPTEIIKISTHSDENVDLRFPIDSRTVSAIHVDTTGVLVAQPGQVTHFPSQQTTLLGFSEGVVGFLGDTSQWCAISSKGRTFYHGGFQCDAEQYLGTKRKTGQIIVLGVASASNGSIYGISYFPRPKDGLFFPSLKFKTIVVSLQSLAKQQGPTFADTRLAPRGHWVSAYISRGSLPRFDELVVPTVGSFNDLLTNKTLAKMRLETYFGIKNHTQTFRALVADLLLAVPKPDPTPADSAILVSYTKFRAASVSSPALLEIASKQLGEEFDFEGQKHNTVIESTSGHKWKRCDITLLPVFSMDTASSSNNQFQVLASESGELRQCPLGEQLVGLPFCIFNGCRFYRRVRARPSKQ